MGMSGALRASRAGLDAPRPASHVRSPDPGGFADPPGAEEDLLLDDGEYVARREDEVLLVVVLHFGAAVLRVDDDVADLDVERNALVAVFVETTRANRQDLALLGLLLCGGVVCSASSGWTRMRSSSGLMETDTMMSSG